MHHASWLVSSVSKPPRRTRLAPILLVATLSFALLRTSPAQAGYTGADFFWVMGHMGSTWKSGVSGTAKVVDVYVEPGTNSHKVGAMVLKEDSNSWVEVGWVDAGGAYKYMFSAWNDNGTYHDYWQ